MRGESSRLSIRPMRMGDVDWVSRCEAQICRFPWTHANFADSLSAGYSGWLLLCDGEPAGYAVMMQVLDEAHLLTIGVSTQLQGQGLGAWILEFILETAKRQGASQIFLEVRPSNAVALSLYRKAGFLSIGRRKGYYPAAEGREDALVLRRAL